MVEKDFRHSVVRSDLTLPVTIVLSSLLWIFPHFTQLNYWLGWVGILLTTYLLMELNNRYRLLRVRSRMVCCSFLALMTALPQWYALHWRLLPLVCFVSSLFLLFDTYQDRAAQGIAFHSFLLLGIGSLVFPPMLLFLPIYHVYMAICLRSLTWRSCIAGLLGFTLPYWFYIGWQVWQNHLETAFDYLLPYLHFAWHDYTTVSLQEWVSFSFVGILTLLSLLHYIFTRFNDKIRVRMYFHIFIGLEFFLLAFIAVFPKYYAMTMPLLIANSAPLIGHYFALAKGKWWMNIWFITWLILWCIWTVFNFGWIPLDTLLGQ